MLKTDFDAFAAHMVEIASLYNKTLSANDINLYFDNLESHSLTQVKNAFAAHQRNPEGGRFFPKIIDLQQQLTINRSGINSDHREAPRCDYVAHKKQCRYPVVNHSATMTVEEGTRLFCRFHRGCTDPVYGAEVVAQSETVSYQKALELHEAKAVEKRAHDMLRARGWVGDCRAEQAELIKLIKKTIGSDKRRQWMLAIALDFFAGKVGSRAPLETCEDGLGFKLKPDTVQQMMAREEAARQAEAAAMLARQQNQSGDLQAGA